MQNFNFKNDIRAFINSIILVGIFGEMEEHNWVENESYFGALNDLEWRKRG